jgi:hypothetical protein
LAHSTKGTPSPQQKLRLRPARSAWFQVSFTPLAGVLFTVPSRYWFTIGRWRYLALGCGQPGFPPDSACRAVLTYCGTCDAQDPPYGALTLSGGPFQRPSGVLNWHASGLLPAPRSRPTPERHRQQAVPPPGFGLLPVRSPLLGESSLFLEVLRCFSSPGSLPSPKTRVPRHARGGLPHSETPGSQDASSSPGRFAAWPRPSSAANAKASTMRSSSRRSRPGPNSTRSHGPGPGRRLHLIGSPTPAPPRLRLLPGGGNLPL